MHLPLQPKLHPGSHHIPMSAVPMTGSTVTNTNCSKKIFFYIEDFYYYYFALVVLMRKENMSVVKTSDGNKLEGESPLWTHPIELLFDLNGTYNLVSICRLCRGGSEGSPASPWSVPLLNS